MADKKIQFFHFNLVDQDATVITGGDENAQFEADNLKDPRSTKVYRSNSASDNVVFDFITIEPVDTIIVRGHLLTGLGFLGSLTIEANATSNFASPAFSTTLTPNQEFNLGFIKLATTQSFRFWRVSGTGSVFFEMSDIFIGEAFESTRNISNNFTFAEDDLSTVTKNRYGQFFVDEIADQKKINGQINLIKKENVPDWRTFINSVGVKKPFWLILDENECIYEDAELMAGKFKFVRKPRLQHVIRGLYNTRIRMEEWT